MRGAKVTAVVLLLGLAGCERSPFREVQVSFEAPVVDSPAVHREGSAPHFRVSVAGMESPSGTYSGYSRLFGEVAHRLGLEADFVQRRTYSEVNQLLIKGELDAALLCTGGYLDLARRDPNAVELISVPVINDSDTYQSLIIVPASSPVQSLRELAGTRFAFTDELSLTGRAWVVHELRTMGRTPETFFGATVFTRSHDRSVAAVARGVVEGAAVHSIVFQRLLEKDPDLLNKVRIIQRSPEFGMTPVVASRRLPPEARARLREVLLGLATDPGGAALLKPLRIDRFEVPPAGLFESASEMLEPQP